MTSADADATARASAEAMWAADVASRALGMSLDEVRPGYARMRMEVSETMVNGHGLCHGGLIFALADSAFAFACNTYGPTTVAAACDIVFVTSAHRGDVLVAEAVERVRFGRNGLYDVAVRRGDEVVAEFRGTSRTIAG